PQGATAGEGRLVLDGSTTVGPLAKAFAEYYMQQNKGVNISVSESGSGNGAKGIINGTCDIGNMSRAMTDAELKAAEEKGVKPVAHIVAMDGIAIIVHPSNPIKALTLAQVKDIYLGKVKRWSDVGGPPLPIVRVSRDTNSGTYEVFEAKIMQGDRIAAVVEYVGSNGAIRQRVQSTPGAIGYVGLGFVDRTVKPLEIEGVMPTKETVATAKYPVSRPLYMYTNGQPKEGTLLSDFVGFYRTAKGREITEAIGFVCPPEK
ncbi:MAG TPA: PstS family phosphate ABC transporter substrate-binding protein, partial [Planctomycetota bacterium]|nr:PstS family phosphate ABC transporter substrate-binding protein [Planctomycetota bacterium]